MKSERQNDMAAARQLDIVPVRAISPYRLTDSERHFINMLRFVGRDCRAMARTDLFSACAVLSSDRTIARAAHAEVLMRCLGEALGKMPVLYRPGETDLSFDEAWLIQLSNAMRQHDTPSLNFLLRSRVVPQLRRNLAFLLRAITDEFTQD